MEAPIHRNLLHFYTLTKKIRKRNSITIPRGGEGEMYGKRNMKTYITRCEIDSQWEFAVWLRKLKQGLCINLEG